jgi:hypothetical protein
MNPIRKLENAIRAAVSSRAAGNREPIELERDILRTVREQVVVRSGGTYIFPHPGIRVLIRVPDESMLQKFAAVFEPSALRAAIREDLLSQGCSAEPEVGVDLSIEPNATGASFEINWDKPRAKELAPMPQARLKVLRGNAQPPEFTITRSRTNIGRMKEVIYADGVLSRRNDVAFDQAETSVAREHATLTYEQDSGVFCLIKGRTTQAATSVSRGDRELTCDSIRGVQLKSGDELNFGKARILFEIAAE